MIKKLIFSLLLFIIPVFISAQSMQKSIPGDIQAKLLESKERLKLRLDSCRLNNDLGKWIPSNLSNNFLQGERKRIDSLNLRLNWGMIVDESMRVRMLQLFNNEYPPEEMEQLLDRWMKKMDSFPFNYEQSAIDLIKADTMQIVRVAKDSLNQYHRDKKENPQRPYQVSDAFFTLQLDTFPHFKFMVDSLRKVERVNKEKEYIGRVMFSMTPLIRASGNVGDKRFVEPLIKILTDLETRNSKETDKNRISRNEREIYEVKSALVKMEIEPYRTDYLKTYSQPFEKIKQQTQDDFAGHLGLFIVMVGNNNQDYLLEISNYLWSSGFTGMSTEGKGGVAYRDAFRSIVHHIENEDFKEMVGNPRTFDIDNRRFEVYEWMQKNYGNYKMKYIW